MMLSEWKHSHDGALSIVLFCYKQMGTTMMVWNGDDWGRSMPTSRLQYLDFSLTANFSDTRRKKL